MDGLKPRIEKRDGSWWLNYKGDWIWVLNWHAAIATLRHFGAL